MEKQEKLRIGVLDSFRAIAILLVMMFHYFSRWEGMYPYADKYNYFGNGKLGVQFFFIISGFVILYSLENTNNFAAFWRNRMIRLFPSMLAGSLLTYIVFLFFDNVYLFPASHYFKNVLASITFIPFRTISTLFNLDLELDYISGSYWSLWPEIQFYAFVSLIYFFVKKINFAKVFLFFSSVLVLIDFGLHHSYNDTNFVKTVRDFFTIFNFIDGLSFFCFGVLFYLFYKDKMSGKATSSYLKIYFLGLVFLQVLGSYSQPLKVVFIFVFLLLFIALIYFPNCIRFLENKIVFKIGVSSYFLYLIHEHIGVLLIHNFGGLFQSYEFIFPLLIIAFLVVLAIGYTYIIEKKVSVYLKNKYF